MYVCVHYIFFRVLLALKYKDNSSVILLSLQGKQRAYSYRNDFHSNAALT